MYMGRIIGTLQAAVRLPGLDAHRMVLVQPLDFHEKPIRFTLVALDITGASVGSLITFVEGREAANPYSPPLPIDALVVALVSSYTYQPHPAS